MSVIFLFIDGVGLGKAKKENPFFLQHYESFEVLSKGNFSREAEPFFSQNHLFKAIDANLEIEGLPQSGTGQTTLFTGKNASKVIGKHFGPYPHSAIKPLLTSQSIFHEVKALGKTPYFINAYPPIFFDIAEKRNRWSCTTLMTKSAGLRLNSILEIKNEVAITAEIVQNAWRERLEIDIPKITATDAAQRVLNVLPSYDLVLYEYYLTDKAGHNQSMEDAERVLKPLDEFILHILKNLRSEDTLVLTSDHGNLEDLSTKTHTRNSVPLMVYGNNTVPFKKVKSLTDVKEAILHTMG